MAGIFGKQGIKCGTHRFFGHRKAGLGGICGIAHECQNAFLAEFSEALKICNISVDGRVIYLKVSRVENAADGRVDGKGTCIGDAVVRPYEFDIEIARIYMVSVCHGLYIRFVRYSVLFKLVSYKSTGKPCRIYRHVKLFAYIGQRTDMILMAVGYHYGLYFIFVLL